MRNGQRRVCISPLRFDAKAVRQSAITVRLGIDSVNPFRKQIYKSLVSVAAKPQKLRQLGDIHCDSLRQIIGAGVSPPGRFLALSKIQS
jgi:hypothetical protein